MFYFVQYRKIPLGKVPLEKNPPENISDNFVKFRKFFPTGDYFGKFRGKRHNILLIKSIICRLYTSVYILLYRCGPKCFRKPSGNFSETFLPRNKLVTTEFIRILHIQKIQIHDCKHVFYFNKFQKVSLGKFPPKENPPENISDNFVKILKFFLRFFFM